MQINCPYCGYAYDLNDLLLPEGNIKARCRSCAKIFILNKNTGASRTEPEYSVKPESFSEAEPAPNNKPAADDAAGNDFMQSVTAEIKSAIAGEIKKQENNGGAGSKKQPVKYAKKKSTSVSPAFLVILVLLLLIAAAAALVYYNIIDISFLPLNLLPF